MRKAYIFIFSDSVGDRKTVQNWLDSIPEIISHWRYDLPHTFYLISEESADVISKKILQHTKKKGRFLITESSENHQGWLPDETWYLLNNKEHKSNNA